MSIDQSPFTPGQPVAADLFVGRTEEVRRLIAHVDATTKGHLRVAFLSGDRGIGKSSLASYVKSYAERYCNMVGAHVFLSGAGSVKEMTRRVFERIVRESTERSWFDSIKEMVGRHVHKAELFGLQINFTPDDKDIDLLSRNFAPATRNIIDKLQKDKKAVGLVLILDDINGLANSQEFADWLKSLVDEIATSGKPLPLCLFIVGIDERRQSLVQLNPSLKRVFDIVRIKPWGQSETAKFYTEAYDRVGVSVDDNAMKILVAYSGGLPELAHEIGDAALREDSDKRIDTRDASIGVVKATEIIGQKHLRQQVLDEIRSKKYRDILNKVAQTVPAGLLHFERSALKEHVSPDEFKAIDNFLRRMKQLGVIVSDTEGPGSYRFASYIIHLYITMLAQRTNAKRGRFELAQ